MLFKRISTATILIVALTFGAAYAQETFGSIRGTVTDPSGAAVPGSSVEVSGTAIPRPFVIITETNGTFHFSQLPPGTGYTLTVAAAGFRNFRATGVAVELGKASTLDVRLEVGQLSDSVVVTADAVMVDTQSSSSAVTIDKSFFDLLPKGRSFYDLIAIAPGARNEGKSGGFEVDGASGSENTFYLDGMEVTSIQQGTLSDQSKIPVEMVQQMQVKNGVMDAQYGGAMGGVVNAVIRSGSNEIHGEAGVYFNNDSMEARDRPTLRWNPSDDLQADFFQNPKDSFSKWNPVFNVGLPILKNKLFFFAGYAPTLTSLDRTVHFNTGEVGTYHQDNKQQSLSSKLDYVATSKIRISTSWVWAPQKVMGELPLKTGDSSYDSPWGGQGEWHAANILAGEVSYLASTKLILSFRGGYHYSNLNTNYGVPNTTAIYTSTTVGSDYSNLPADLQGMTSGWTASPPANALTFYDTYTRQNYNADASYMFNFYGQHNIKGGWQMNKLSNDVLNSTYPGGYYRYYWNLTYKCVTSQCTSGTGNYGYYRYRELATMGNVASNNQALFLQDNWKVSKHLSLNLGLRTEREFVPSFSSNKSLPSDAITFNWPQKMSPRIGGAWDIKGDGKQRLYASWGWFYDIMKYELPRGSFGGDVWKEYYYTLDDASLFNTNQGMPADPTKLPGKFLEMVDWRIPSNDPSKNLIDPNLKPVKQQMFDVGYDYSISSTLVASARYTNRRLLNTIEDTGYIGENGETYLIANPGYGITADPQNWLKWMGPGIPTSPKPVRKYDALELRLDKRFSSKYQFSASYTLSRLWGNYSGLASSDEDGRTSPNVNRYYDQPWVGVMENGKYAYGRLATDRPNTFKLFAGYTLKSRFGSTTLSPFIQLYSGTPITTEANLVSTTPSFPFGRGDLGRTPMFFQTDANLMHEFAPLKSHENVRVRLELSVFNLFNNDTVTNRYKTLLHSNYGQIQFQDADGNPTYADIFKGFDVRSLMASQGVLQDPLYNLPSGWQSPRSMRLQLSFFF